MLQAYTLINFSADPQDKTFALEIAVFSLGFFPSCVSANQEDQKLVLAGDSDRFSVTPVLAVA